MCNIKGTSLFQKHSLIQSYVLSNYLKLYCSMIKCTSPIEKYENVQNLKLYAMPLIMLQNISISKNIVLK